MAQQIQEFINKIKTEGIQEAQIKSKHIETQAHQKADAIISEAKVQAEKILSVAKDETRKMQQAANVSITQAARNSILSLRKDIEGMLRSVIVTQVKESLSSEQLSVILEKVISNYLASNSSGTIQLTLSAEDAAAVKDSLIAKFQKQLKQPITFKTSGEMAKGFAISFDGGKSSFDFSDASLAEYLGAYVNIEVAQLIKSSVN